MPPTIRPSGRFSVERRPDDLWIFIAPRRAWGFVAFLCVWLCGWVFGEAMALVVLAGMATGASDPATGPPFPVFVAVFLVVWLTFWTLGGYWAIRTLLGELGSWQEIYLSRHLLMKRTRLFGRVRETVVDLSTVEEFRVTTPRRHPEDWRKDTVRVNEGPKQGIAIRYGEEKTLLLLVEQIDARDAFAGREWLTDKVRQALEEFQIPVTPLGEDPLSSPLGSREEFHDPPLSTDREERPGKQQVVPAPTAPEPFLQAIRHWTAQIVLGILALGGWFFWTRLGGVSSLYFALMAGYLLFFLVVGFLVFQRGLRRRMTGKPWSPPLKGTWKDEFKSLAVVFVASFAIGGLGWFLCLQMPSRNLGRLDAVRRHVYSFGPELQSLEDGAGNRYTIRNFIEMSPRLHKYGPDGRLRWAISLETYRGVDPVLSIDPDGSLVIRMGSHVERYDSDGWEIGTHESPGKTSQ